MPETFSPGWRRLTGVYLTFLGVYLTTAMGHFWSTDFVAIYLTTQSMVERGSLAIKHILNTSQGVGGEYYSGYGIGQSIAAIPFYLIGRFVEAIGSEGIKKFFAGANLGDWGGSVPLYFVSLFDQFMVPLTCLLVLSFCLKLGYSWRPAFLTTLLFGFATGAWIGARDFYQQPLEGLLLLAPIYVLYAGKDRLTARHAWLAGGLLGFGLLVRLNMAIALPFVFAYFLWIGTKDVRNTWAARARPLLSSGANEATGTLPTQLLSQAIHLARLGVAFGIPILLGIAGDQTVRSLKFSGTNIETGAAMLDSQAFAPLQFLPEGLYGNLFSPGGSIFLYSPPVFLGVFLMWRFFRSHRGEALLFTGIALAYLLFFSSWAIWHGQWTYGPRYLWPILPFLVIPCAAAFERKWTAVAALVLGMAGFGVQVLGATINPGYVHLDYISMGAENASPTAFKPYLFDPAIAPISRHFGDFFAGKHIDLWLNWVLQQFGFGAFLATAAVPAGLFVIGVQFIRRAGRPVRRADRRRTQRQWVAAG